MNSCHVIPCRALLLVGWIGLLLGCQKEPLDSLSEDKLKERRHVVLNVAKRQGQLEFSPWPDGLPKQPIRLLVAQGLFEAFEPVAPDQYALLDESTDDLWEGIESNIFQKADRDRLADLKSQPNSGRLFYRRKAPALVDFEKEYEVEVRIDHLVDDDFHQELVQTAETRIYNVESGIPLDTIDQYDLVFAPRHWLTNLRGGESIANFDQLKVTRAADYKASTLAKFPNLPSDPDFEFTFPYYWTTYGLVYQFGKVKNMPRQWSDFFEYTKDTNLWGRVSYIDNHQVAFGTAAHYWYGLSETNAVEFSKRNAELVELVRTLSYQSTNTVSEGAESQGDVTGASLMATTVLAEKNMLRALFASAALEHAYSRTNSTPSSKLKFHLPTENQLLTNSLPQLYDFLKREEHNLDAIVQIDDEEDYETLSNLILKTVAYGARFRRDREISTFADGSIYLALGSGTDAYLAHRANNNFRFLIPDAGSFVVMYLFIHPQGRTPESQSRTQFLLEYLTQPKIAAEMSQFDLLASADEEASQFLSREITLSPIYSRPERNKTVYLPIRHVIDHEAANHWTDIKEFAERIHSVLDYH